MGSKSHSKQIMDDAGVPTTPGYHGDDDQSVEKLRYEAVTNVGFPLLIKATMGGGGKGMRLVWNENEFLSALESCRSESQSAFGDQNVILEKYLVHPRHIEIQVMADGYGNAVYLHERDCSLQRRHQKIIEEAPASDLPDTKRKLMGETAVKAAQAVGYVNAGTVEFLVDTKSEDNDFYFCEMNTRLQVEHPITEMITQQDLVEWQLRIAAGEELPIKDQEMIPCHGHAMEARIYAENPLKDFLPVTGKVWHHGPPAVPNVGGTDVRVDTCIETGKDITVYYDPMISKLIVHGDDREECRQNLINALEKYQVAGIPTNIPFLINCAKHEVFAKQGAMNTGFLDIYGNDVKIQKQNLGSLEQAICAFVVALKIENRIGNSKQTHVGPWSNWSGSWRAGGKSGRFCRTFEPENDDGKAKINCTSNHDGSFEVSFESNHRNQMYTLDGTLDEFNNLNIVIDGAKKQSYNAIIHEDIDAATMTVNVWTNDIDQNDTEFAFDMTFKHPLPIRSKSRQTNNQSPGDKTSFSMHAPMPGKVIRINAVEGDQVGENEAVIVMEAMKMEHVVKAPTNGEIEKINCVVGDIVDDGEILASVKIVEKNDKSTNNEHISAPA